MELWGLDLGGTKIEGVVLKSLESREVLFRNRIATERDYGYEHILGRIKLLVDWMAKEVGHYPDRIGIGTPGTIDPKDGLLKNSNTVCLNGTPLNVDLNDMMGIPFTMANDANCFALAETLMGSVREKAPDARVTFGVIMGTGAGGGIVVDKKVINGLHGIAGEWGHIFLDESGGRCYCGQIGCVENIISGTALEKWYQEQTGAFKKMKQIYEDHEKGIDPAATQTIERLIHFFGKGISYILNILDPDAIILGGGVGNIPLLYTRGREEAIKHLFNERLDTPFLKPSLGDSAGVFGAALLVS
jgi:predicted NBD/HSP70 family sugar kinase